MPTVSAAFFTPLAFAPKLTVKVRETRQFAERPPIRDGNNFSGIF